MLSQMTDESQKISEAHLINKSKRQKKRWRTPKETVLKTFIDVVGGDRPMRHVTRTDVRAFRQHLLERIVGEEIEIDTANKIIGHIRRRSSLSTRSISTAARYLREGTHLRRKAQAARNLRRGFLPKTSRRAQRRGARPHLPRGRNRP